MNSCVVLEEPGSFSFTLVFKKLLAYMRRTKQATCFPVLHVHESRRLAEDAKFPSRRSGGKAGPHFSENELYRIPTDNQIFFFGGGVDESVAVQRSARF